MKNAVTLRGWPEMQLNEIRAFEAVIASQINGGCFADIDLSEAIQLFYEKDWIASSQSPSKTRALLLAMTNANV